MYTDIVPSKFTVYFNKFVAKPLRLIGLFNYGYCEIISNKSVDETQAILRDYIVNILGFSVYLEGKSSVRADQLLNAGYTKKDGRSTLDIKTSVLIKDNKSYIIFTSESKNGGLTFGNRYIEIVKGICAHLANNYSFEIIYTNE